MPTKNLLDAIRTSGQNPLNTTRVKDAVAAVDIVAVTGAGTVFVRIGNRVVEAQPTSDKPLRPSRQGWVSQLEGGGIVIHGSKD